VQGLICGVAFLVNISLKTTGVIRLKRGKGADIPKPLSLRLRCLTRATAAEHTTRRTRPMTSLVAHSGSCTYQSWKGTNSRINAAASKTQPLTIWWRSGWGIAASNFSSVCIPAAPQRDPLPDVIHGPISTDTGSLRVETIQPGPYRTRLNDPTWPAWQTPVWR